MRLPLPVHSYRVPGSTARLVNCYGEKMPEGAKGPVRVTTAPGVETFSSVLTYALQPSEASPEGRGLCVFNGQLYAVIGSGLFLIESGGLASRVGTIQGTGAVGMTAGVNRLVIAAGGVGYTMDAARVLSPISDADWRATDIVDFLDNYIIGVERDTGRWFASNLADEAAYDPLYFATAEGAPDNLVTLIADHRQALLFGVDSLELWYNAGGEGFPFLRSPNGFIELGCIAKWGVCKLDNSVFWVASDGTIRRLNGGTPTRVSTHSVETALETYTIAAARAFAYTIAGHLCAVFRFPEGCFVYDATTNEWFERHSYDGSTWNIVDTAVAYGRTFALHADSGSVGVLTDQTFAEFDDVLRAEWTYQPVYADNRDLFHGRLEIGLETGTAAPNVSAHVQLHASDDGGKSWRGLPDRSLGLTGEYPRVYWHRLGRSRQRVYRAAVSSPVPLTVTGTFLEAE